MQCLSPANVGIAHSPGTDLNCLGTDMLLLLMSMLGTHMISMLCSSDNLTSDNCLISFVSPDTVDSTMGLFDVLLAKTTLFMSFDASECWLPES